MNRLKWSNGFSVALDDVDRDHRRLIGIINQLSELLDNNAGREALTDVFSELESYVVYHFQREEGLLAKYQCSHSEEHLAQHDLFTDSLPKLRAQLIDSGNYAEGQKAIIALIRWLLEHIIVHDVQMSKEIHASKLWQQEQGEISFFSRMRLSPAKLRGLLVIPAVVMALLVVLQFVIDPILLADYHLYITMAELTAMGLTLFSVAVLFIKGRSNSRLFAKMMRRMAQGSRDLWLSHIERNELMDELMDSHEELRRSLLRDEILSMIDLNLKEIEVESRSREHQSLEQMAFFDPLTGLHNRRRFDQLVEAEIKRARRHDHPLSYMMLDLDHFKHVNDNYGHAVGDDVLKRFAQLVQSTVRDSDLVARLGGEEFGILLPDTNLDEARAFAERIRLQVEQIGFETDSQAFHVTVSTGVASFRHQSGVETFQSLAARADMALYQAKHEGRNLVVTEQQLRKSF